MRIVFVCGSLEMGKDGVGDYTRRLSTELIRQGHKVAIIAISDRHTNNAFFETQICDGQEIEVLRLPKNIVYNQKTGICLKFIENLNPDWLSLQFVPFGFQDKGLPFGLSRFLKAIGGNRKWHIMFHELWVGMEYNAKIKMRIWGKIQKMIIIYLVKVLNPFKITTQSKYYQRKLFFFKSKVVLLPLFSNIKKYPILYFAKEINKIKFIIFGSIHPNVPFKSFISELVEYAQPLIKTIEFVFIGNCGAEEEKWLAILKDYDISVISHGYSTDELISTSMQKADFGIVTTLPEKLEKSGTVAALNQHKVPIICIHAGTNENIDLDYLNNAKLYRIGFVQECLMPVKETPIYYDADIIASHFVKILAEN